MEYLHISDINKNTQLLKLRDQLFKKHLIVSVPILICIIVGFIVISFVIGCNNMGKQLILDYYPPELILSDILQLTFNNTIKHIQYLSSMIMSLHQQNIDITNGTMNISQYNKITYGGVCIVDYDLKCGYLFGKLFGLVWQYQQKQQVSIIMDRVILCTHNGRTCASTQPINSQPITSQQLQFISSLAVNVSTPGYKYEISQYNYNTGRVYMGVDVSRSIQSTVDVDTVIIVKLNNINDIILQLLADIQKNNINSIQINVNYPQYHQYKQSLQQRCVLCSQSSTYEQIQIFYNTQLFLQLNIQYQRYQQYVGYCSKISCILPIIFLLFVVKIQKQSISQWVIYNFCGKTLINQLYKYTIRDIFTGIKPNISNILQRGPTSQLFKCLSELVEKNITPIYPQPEPNPHRQAFKFTKKITQIIQKYNKSVQPLMQAKNRNILANRFNIQTYINDLCQSQARTIKDYYVRAHELKILKQFFTFSYMAILRPVQQFLTFIHHSQTPLPKKLLDFFIRMNQNIHKVEKIRQKIQSFHNDSQQQKEADKKQTQSQKIQICSSIITNSQQVNALSQQVGSSWQGKQQQPYLQENKQQLQIRIRVHMIPKYLTILRDLDSRNNNIQLQEDKGDGYQQDNACTYAQILDLDKQLRSLGEIIQNTRYLLTKHNKTIRMFNK